MDAPTHGTDPHHQVPHHQDPYLVVSSDCHAGLPTEEYCPYLDSRFHRPFTSSWPAGRPGARR
ncbi:hypothetical protein GCM10010211_68460 [Streptomyces albospinus]|uniref:Amidohydrolase n=1 Tax=Streptomyces albospinus TaxID=285515 RepID=A0ABQ2VNB4_9ACTN|nr:hypothetical protein GCM10010211_68460 [Streptomyces albospinus]